MSSQQFQQQQNLQQQFHQQQYLVDQRVFRSPLKQSTDLQQSIQFSSFHATPQKTTSQKLSQQCNQPFHQGNQPIQQFNQPTQQFQQQAQQFHQQAQQNAINSTQPILPSRPAPHIPPRPQPILTLDQPTKQTTNLKNQNQLPQIHQSHNTNSKAHTQYSNSSQHCNPYISTTSKLTHNNTKITGINTPNNLSNPSKPSIPSNTTHNPSNLSNNPLNPSISSNNPTSNPTPNNISHEPIVRTNSVEEEMREAFKFFDIDGNGLIDAQELKQTMQSLDEMISDQDVEAMILAVDKNGDGKVDYEGWLNYLAGIRDFDRLFGVFKSVMLQRVLNKNDFRMGLFELV